MQKVNQDPEKYLSSLLETVPDCIFFKNKHSEYILASKSTAQSLGSTPEDIVGKTPFDFYPEELAQKCLEEDKWILENEQSIINKEKMVEKPDGTEVWLSVTKVPRYDRNGNLEGTLGIARDITKRKDHREKLEAIEELSCKIKLTDDKIVLYETILDYIDEVFGYGSYAICEKRGKNIHIVRVTGKYLPEVEGRVLDLNGKGLIPAACRDLNSLYISDVTKDDRYVQATLSPGSEYVVPIEIEGELYGALDIENEEKGAINEQDRELLDILGSQIAVALQGIKSLNLVDEHKNKLRKLHEAVEQLQQKDSQEDLVQTAVDVAENMLDFESCDISLVEGNYLVPKATSSAIKPDETNKFTLEEGLAGETVRERKTMWGKDLSEYPQAKPSSSEFKSFISVPIGDLGCFQVVSKKSNHFTKQDVELSEILIDHLYQELRRAQLEEQLRHQATHDPLTGVFNRRYFNEALQKEVDRSKRYGHSLAFIILDIDDFKKVNDNYSHLIGDKVLQQVAELLQKNVRDADSVIRYGGDEFLIMIPETDKVINNMANRLNEKLEEWNEKSELVDIPVTAAIGRASWNPEQNEDIEEVLARADSQMYLEKKSPN